MIKLENINKFYHSSEGAFHALTDINLTLPDQGMVYIVGKSGSGKSTLLNVIGGIDNYDSGRLIIENTVIKNDGTTEDISLDTQTFKKKDYNSYRNTYIGFIFQEFNVVKGLTVYENIALSLSLQQISVKKNHQKILDIIAKVGLAGKEKRRINELSGGERQRVAIARALVKDPKVIIADEPTGNLDSKNRDIVMDILKDLSKEKLILIVTHDKHLASRYGDREISIKDGRIINDVLTHPENLKEVVPTHHDLTPISPKPVVSLDLAWKGFKLNKFRFIFIIILFSISLIFAGTVVNLYLANTTKEFATWQKDNGNNVVTLSNEFEYQGITKSSALYTYTLETLIKEFHKNKKANVSTYQSMTYHIPFNSGDMELFDNYYDYIDYITIYDDESSLDLDFKITEKDYSSSYYKCFVTDYIASNLVLYGAVSSYSSVVGSKLTVPGMSHKLTIVGILQTNYTTMINNITDENITAFNDNMAIYNSIFVSKDDYSVIFSSDNVTYVTENIIYKNNPNYFKQTPSIDDSIKLKYITSTDKLLEITKTEDIEKMDPITGLPTGEYEVLEVKQSVGTYPYKPKAGDAPNVAVSSAFLKDILGFSADNATTTYDGDGLAIGVTIPGAPSFHYLAGYNYIPVTYELNIVGIIDSDEYVIYAPSIDEYNLFSVWLNSKFLYGGYLTAYLNMQNDEDINNISSLYRNLLDEDITINNQSFRKLQLIDNFISDNLFLFAILFFSFCLFSVLMIFNFVIINIKNSTRDIGIYMSLGMNGWKISLIYLFQVLIISTISLIIGLIGSKIFLSVIDSSFTTKAFATSSSFYNIKILKFTFLGVLAVFALSYITPIIAVISPLLSLSRKKPVDVIKVS